MSQLNKHLTTDHRNAATDPHHHTASGAKDDIPERHYRWAVSDRNEEILNKCTHTHMHSKNQNASKVRGLLVGLDLLHPPIVCVHESVCVDQ